MEKTLGAELPNKSSSGRVIRAAYGPDKVGSFRIRPLWGAGVSVRYGCRLHCEECQKASPCVPTRVGCHVVM